MADAELSRWSVAHGSGCSPAIAEALVRAGANPRARNSDGRSLRSLATERGMIGTLRWLDEHRIP